MYKQKKYLYCNILSTLKKNWYVLRLIKITRKDKDRTYFVSLEAGGKEREREGGKKSGWWKEKEIFCNVNKNVMND